MIYDHSEPADGEIDLSIIIVNWNSRAYVRDCLASLLKYCRLNATEILVVDSGSFDGCDQMIADEFPWVRFVQSPQNVGFARANNLGVRVSNGRHLLFLNPDTQLMQDAPALLSRRLLALPRAGIIGPRLLNPDRSLQMSCVQNFPTVLNQVLDSAWLRARFPRSPLWGAAVLYDNLILSRSVAAVSGACLAITREAFAAVGGFTETYSMYAEDIDLCRKVRDAGWEVYHTPEASLIHFGGGSSGQAPGGFSTVAMRDSIHHFILTHDGPIAAAAYRIAMGFAAAVRLLLIGPAELAGDRLVRHGRGSWQKWLVILRWSVGLEHGAARKAIAASALPAG